MWIRRGNEAYKVEKFAEKLFEIKERGDCPRVAGCSECPLNPFDSGINCKDLGLANDKMKLKEWAISDISSHRIGRFYS